MTPPGAAAVLDPASREIVRVAARSHEPDRYLAALLAPRRARADLIALAAFAGEVARIPAAVSEPMIGLIRLQWWRDSIAGLAPGVATGNPVADALAEAVVRRGLDRALLLGVVERHADTLSEAPVDEATVPAAFVRDVDGALFTLAADCLEVPRNPEREAAVAAAARGYGLARLLVAHPDLPAADLAGEARRAAAEFRSLARAQPRALRTACLPVALVEPYLRGLDSRGDDSRQRAAGITPFARVWRLWWAHRFGGGWA